MKKAYIIITLITCFGVNGLINAQVVKLFESDTIYRAPESIAYDSIRDLIYVSNYTAPLKDGGFYGQHTITKANLKGEILEADWITGLSCPTGICIYRDHLFIVERFGVVEYDLEKEQVINKYYIKTDEFLNDITLDPEGTIYISVSGAKQIYRIKEGIVELWLEHDSIDNPNGILFDQGKIVIGTITDCSLKLVNPETKEIQRLARLGEGTVDGIKACGEGYLTSIFQGNLFWVSKTGEVKELLNTREEKLFLADFEYIPSKNLILVPALWNNKLVGFEYAH